MNRVLRPTCLVVAALALGACGHHGEVATHAGTDLSPFRRRGGKLMVYHGGADSSISLNDTLRWYDAMNRQMGGSAQDFARMFNDASSFRCE